MRSPEISLVIINLTNAIGKVPMTAPVEAQSRVIFGEVEIVTTKIPPASHIKGGLHGRFRRYRAYCGPACDLLSGDEISIRVETTIGRGFCYYYIL